MSTIAAISTPIGNGGIGIVKISGKDALEITQKVYRGKNLEANTIKYGKIIGNDGNVIDEALVSYFKAPKTYTGEDVCEINCHGGTIILKQILELVIKNGATMATAGEFSKRAFLNGKIDLSQAEAIIDVINSKTEKESKASQKQLQGMLSKKIREIKDEIVGILVDIEANIDYPEYDIEEVEKSKIIEVLEETERKIKMLEESFNSGKILKDGINTAIIGKPNVGKSSLLNVMVREERAIVTEIAGTTRDTIEEFITIKGVPLKIIDTAGIRETNDKIEGIGIEKSRKAIEGAELILMLLDATHILEEADIALMGQIKPKKHIIIINKIDADNKISKNDIEDENVVEISAKTLQGIDNLENKIEEMFNMNDIQIGDEIIITNIRHKELISKTGQGVEEALNTIKSGLPVDMISVILQTAIQNLGEIIGENVSEDIINGIFSKFCVGK